MVFESKGCSKASNMGALVPQTAGASKAKAEQVEE